MNARDIMTTPVHTIRDTATIGEAARLLTDQRISALPVLDQDEELVGVLTHTDFFLHPIHYPGTEGHLFELLGSLVGVDDLESASKALAERSVRDVMTHPVITITEDADIGEIARLMLHDKRTRLPVVRDEKVVGIVCRHDFLKLITTAKSVD